MTTSFCCEICWRNPTCGNDCGSCDPSLAAVNRAADVLAEIISGEKLRPEAPSVDQREKP